MTFLAQIGFLEDLASLDAALAALDDELAGARAVLSEKERGLAGLEARVGTHRTSIEEMERTRNELMQEVRQMSVQVERSREKLARCRTEREANAAQREVEEIRKLYRDREIEIEKLNGLADQARTDLEDVEAKRDALAGELGASAGDTSTRLGQLEQEAGRRRSEREDLVGKVKPQLYRKYEMIRKRRGTALCHTVDGSCSACHIHLPPMVFQRLMRGEEFDQCPSCNRLIYYRSQLVAQASTGGA